MSDPEEVERLARKMARESEQHAYYNDGGGGPALRPYAELLVEAREAVAILASVRHGEVHGAGAWRSCDAAHCVRAAALLSKLEAL